MGNVIFHQTETDDLVIQIADKVLERLEHLTPGTDQQEELITSTTTANILGVSKPTLHRWKMQGFIPFYRIGTRIRFKRSEVMEFLNSKKWGEVK